MGSRGSLWGSGKGTLEDYPPSHLSFKKHILPIFRSKCAPCHIPGETWTRIATRSDVKGDPVTMIDYSHLLDLTSYDGSVVSVNNDTWTKGGIKDLTVSYQDHPDASPVLSKTRHQKHGNVIHAGGAFWSTSDDDYRAIKRWVAEGRRTINRE